MDFRETIIKYFIQLSIGNVIVLVTNMVSLFVMVTYYSKASIATYTLFASLSFLFGLFSTLKLPIAIVRAENKNEQQEWTSSSFSILLISIIGLMMLLFISIFTGFGWQLFIIDSKVYFELLFLFLFLFMINGSLQIFTANLQKTEKFGSLSSSRVIRAVSYLIFLILFTQFSTNGIILAFVLSFFGQATFQWLKLGANKINFASLSLVQQSLKSNKDLCLFSLPTSVSLSLYENITVQSIQFFAGPQYLAFYTVIDRLFKLPAVIFGAPISEILLKKGSDLYQNNKGVLTETSILLIKKIVPVFLVFIGLVYFFAPIILPYFLNASWVFVIDFIKNYSFWMIPFFFISLYRVLPVILKNQAWYFKVDFPFHIIILSLLVYLLYTDYNIEQWFKLKFVLEALVFSYLVIFVLYKTKKYEDD